MMTLQELQITVEEMQLPQQDRVRLAHWLLDGVVNPVKVLARPYIPKRKTAGKEPEHPAQNEQLAKAQALMAQVDRIADATPEPVNIDMIWDAVKQEQDERHADLFEEIFSM